MVWAMVLDVKRGRPPSCDGLLSRGRLIARLQQEPDVPLLAVVAPAGYGKTSLLWEWLSEDPRDGVWVMAEDRHNDPLCLLEEIVRGLDDIEPFLPDLLDTLHGLDPDLAGTVLPRLVSGLALRARPTLIVLDDAHTLSARSALRTVGSLAEHLPPGSQLALASRTASPLHLGRLRAHRALLELHAEDLAMTFAEAAELLDVAGLHLSAVELEMLMDRTEGWPAGLYMAALSLREESQVGAALARFSGSDRVVADYMWEEFLSDLSAEEIDLLTRTAILQELHGPLCDAVVGRLGSARLLERLARATNLLLVPLDRSGQRYRCHRLLRDTLLSELRRGDSALEIELHRRASDWHAAQGELDSAIDHAVAGGDANRAGDLLWENLPRYITHGENSSVQRWLGAFASIELAAHPALALAAAHSHLAGGDIRLAEHWGLAAASALGRIANRPVHPVSAGSANPVADRAHRLRTAAASYPGPSARSSSVASLPAGVALIEAAVARQGVLAMGQDAARAYAA